MASRFITSIAEVANLTEPQRDCLEAMYARPTSVVLAGGAGFGGKSHLLRAAAIDLSLFYTQHGHRGVPILLGTSTYPALQDRQITKFAQQWGNWGEVVGSQREGLAFRLKIPGTGPILLRNFDKAAKRKGSEVGGAFVDELTELTREQFGEILYTARLPGLPCNPFIGATNPDGIGMAWVKQVWRPHRSPDERLQDWGEEVGMEPGEDPKNYMYIPFLPTHNPMYTDELWARMTSHLSPAIRRARRYGLWDAPEGAFFDFLEPEVHQYKPSKVFPHGIPDDWPRIIGYDYGLRAPFCTLWHALDMRNYQVYTYRELYKTKVLPESQARAIRFETTEQEPISRFLCDPAIFSKLPDHRGEVDESVAEILWHELKTFQDDQGRHRIPPPEPGYNASRAHGAQSLIRLLSRDNEYWDWHISEDCPFLWEELTNAVYPTKDYVSVERHEVFDERCPDHALTASWYSLWHLVEPVRERGRMKPPRPRRQKLVGFRS